MNESSISKQISLALEIMEKNKDNEAALRQQYKNILGYELITDEERELLTEKIEKLIKTNHPKLSKNIFGPKDAEGRAILQKMLEDLKVIFDFSGNVIKNGVKTGGLMIAGDKYVDVYMSYKNKDKYGALISYSKDRIDSHPYFTIIKYFKAFNNKKSKDYEEYFFNLEDSKLAFSKYEEYLTFLI